MTIKAHILKRGHEPMSTVTSRTLRYWWTRVNRELFDGELHSAQLQWGAIPKEDSPAMGVTYSLEAGLCRIVLDSTLNDTRKAFLATLAHEMVHQWQHQNGLPLNHGPTFKKWQRIAKRKVGLPL